MSLLHHMKQSINQSFISKSGQSKTYLQVQIKNFHVLYSTSHFARRYRNDGS